MYFFINMIVLRVKVKIGPEHMTILPFWSKTLSFEFFGPAHMEI